MENQGIYLHQPSPIRPISATSAVDLTGTGFAKSLPSAPSSPSLDPTGSRHVARRRSWGNREVDTHSDAQPPLQSAPARFAAEPDSMLPSNDNPFYTSGDDHSSFSSRDHPYSADNAGRYHGLFTSDEYSNSNRHVGPSTASLINGFRGEGTEQEADAMEDEHREDDEAHLTANMPREDALEDEEGYSSDPEHEGATPRSKRRTRRYSLSPSPLKLTGTAMKSVSKTMRRVSLRVVNLAGTGLAEQIRLGDDEETARRAPMDDEPSRPDLSKSLPIRGRTLGFLGPDSKVRLWLFNFLVYQCVSCSSLTLNSHCVNSDGLNLLFFYLLYSMLSCLLFRLSLL